MHLDEDVGGVECGWSWNGRGEGAIKSSGDAKAAAAQTTLGGGCR